MVIELERELYKYIKSLINDIKETVGEEKPTREELIKTSIKGHNINVSEYTIKDGLFKGLYIYLSNYKYDSTVDTTKENRTEICITSANQFENVKAGKRCFSPTNNINNCSFIVFEKREYQRNSISFMIKENSETRYVYRITESKSEDVYAILCEKYKDDSNCEKEYEQVIKPESPDIINKLVMPKLQLYGEMMELAINIKKSISRKNYGIKGPISSQSIINKPTNMLSNRQMRIFVRDIISAILPTNNSIKGSNSDQNIKTGKPQIKNMGKSVIEIINSVFKNGNSSPNNEELSQDRIFELMREFDKARTVKYH